MASGGASNSTNRQKRLSLPASAGDVLPTAGVIAAAKRHAAQVCCHEASHRAWNVERTAAHDWIEMIPLVALEALSEVCPDIPPARLARCLGLDPLDGPDGIAVRKRGLDWPEDAVVLVVERLRSGQ